LYLYNSSLGEILFKNTPVAVLIVSNDSRSVGELVGIINERLGNRVAVVAIYRDYHFDDIDLKAVEIMMGNGLCKTRDEWVQSFSIYFPVARMAARKARIPFISVGHAFLRFRLKIKQLVDERTDFQDETWQINEAAIKVANLHIVDKLEKVVAKLEKRRNSVSPATA